MPNERRRNQRRKVLLEARWENVSKRHEVRVDDISLSGCFVNTYAPVEKGELVELSILRRSGEWLQVRGHVAMIHHGVGFGMAFIDLTKQQERSLLDLMLSGG